MSNVYEHKACPENEWKNALLLSWLLLLLVVVMIAALGLAWTQVPVIDNTVGVLRQF